MNHKISEGVGSPPDSIYFSNRIKNTNEIFLSQNHKAAVIYSRLGFYVFPLVPRAKIPLTTNGFKDSTLDEDRIRLWWERNPDANIAVDCGRSGLAVIDVDSTEQLSALDALGDLEEKFGRLPTTPNQCTGGGGFQFFYKGSVPSRTRMYPNVDIKSEGGYVVLPPSTHPNGIRYCWDVLFHITETPIADIPKWLVTQCGSKLAPKPKANNFWSDLFHDGIVEGQRNDSFAKLAGYFFRKNLDALLVREILNVWNSSKVKPPLEINELERVIDSVARLEIKRRFGGANVIR